MHALLFLFVLFTPCVARASAPFPKDSTTAPRPSPVVVRTPTPAGFSFDGVMDTTLVSQYIRSIFHDSKGNLWFGTAFEGVCRYDGLSLTYYTKLDVFGGNSVHAIAEDKEANLWFGTDQGVFKYDGKRFTNYRESQGLTSIWVGRNSLLIDHSDNVWVGTEGGVFRYNPSADTAGGKCFSPFPRLASTRVRGMLEDNAGNIWFASEDSGVYRFDGKTITNISEKEGLGNNYAGGMLQDKSGTFWFTMKDGICRYDGNAFTNLTTKDGLGGSEVWGIYEETSGIIWITARGSTTRYDPSADKAGGTPFTVFTEKDGLNCCVQSMHQDRSGNMWWGAGSGLFRFDGKRFYQVKQKGPW